MLPAAGLVTTAAIVVVAPQMRPHNASGMQHESKMRMRKRRIGMPPCFPRRPLSVVNSLLNGAQKHMSRKCIICEPLYESRRSMARSHGTAGAWMLMLSQPARSFGADCQDQSSALGTCPGSITDANGILKNSLKIAFSGVGKTRAYRSQSSRAELRDSCKPLCEALLSMFCGFPGMRCAPYLD